MPIVMERWAGLMECEGRETHFVWGRAPGKTLKEVIEAVIAANPEKAANVKIHSDHKASDWGMELYLLRDGDGKVVD